MPTRQPPSNAPFATALDRRQALLCLFGGMALAANSTGASARETAMIEDFSGNPQSRWEFITDQVMGGISSGQARFERSGARTVLRLSGTVSTANNGGFIQARLPLSSRLPGTARGLVLRVRGNGQGYYVHARTDRTILPWTFYQAPFATTRGWQDRQIAFSDFLRRGTMLPERLRPETIKSLAVVAYGRDHSADLSVASIALY